MKKRRLSPITELHRNWQAYGRETDNNLSATASSRLYFQS
jgi:hypothetical protein